jgi:predicted O-methyltransferase YrrM
MSFDIQTLRASAGHTRLGRLWRWGHSANGIGAILRAPDESSKSAAVRQLFPEVSEEMAEACRLELLRNHGFYSELNAKFVEKRQRRANGVNWNEVLYMLVRFAKPEIVFETGVFDGVSSATTLQALEDNRKGLLVSIDLPARSTINGSTDRMTDTTLPPGQPPGWVIPDHLRHRHQLHQGDSKALLPELLKQYPRIDIFFHDSLHTLEHQYFEYTTAWPHLAEGGLLLSDDIFFNSAFDVFCKEENRKYVHVGGFGAIRK